MIGDSEAIDKTAILSMQNSDDDFSPVDLFYLIKLCQYENEHRVKKLDMRKYADRQQLAQKSDDKFVSIKDGKIEPQVL